MMTCVTYDDVLCLVFILPTTTRSSTILLQADCALIVKCLHFVANLCMISAFLWGLLDKCESALEMLWCGVCLHEYAEPGVWVEVSS